MTRVVVVGRGLAGATAALAAREKGAEVLCVARAEGRTAFSSGLIGAAGGITADFDVSLNETLTNLLKRRRRHPYALLDNPYAALLDALSRFVDMADDLYPDEIADEQPAFRALTEAGSLVPTTVAPRHMARLHDLDGFARIGVLGLSGYPPFRAAFLATAWRNRLGEDVQVLPVAADFDLKGRPLSQPGVLARVLDRDEIWSLFCERVVSALAGTPVDAVLVPPVLGLARKDGAKSLSRLLGCPVFETVPLAGPSVPGQRLSALLSDRLTRRGVQHLDAEVLGGVGGGRRLGGLVCRTREGRQQRLDVDAVVLASGKFLGGGLARRNRRLEETILGLPVMVGGRLATDLFIGKITKPDFMKSQPLSRAGLVVDTAFRPLTLDAVPAFENVFAAGQILGGFDPFTDGCAEGVDIVTGRVAGRNAAEVGA